jgi:hypothetical protein
MARRKDRTAIEQIEWMRNLLAFMLTGAFVSTIPLFVFKSIPEANEQVVTYMVGQLSGMALMALGFYFVNKVGQDAIDATRADNTGKLADLAHEAMRKGTGDDALHPGDTVTINKPELDTSGLPWDIRIHREDKAVDSDGRWLRRDDVDDATFDAVVQELRGTQP